MHLISKRSLFTRVVAIALTCLTTSARAQDTIAKPLAETAPAPPGLPAPPNMMLLHPEWTLLPPVTGFDPPKAVQTTRVVPQASPAGYFVRISDQFTEEEAIASFDDLKTRFPDLLKERQALVRRINSRDGGTHHRLLVGPFETSGDAYEACNTIKTAGGPCIVQRN